MLEVERPIGVSTQASAPQYGSDAVVAVLRELGYKYVAMNPGSSWRGLHDSLVNFGGNEDPQVLLCLHEEIAISLAHGYAKASGQPVAAAVHDLVGLMHASMAVYNAACDQVPLLLLGGSGPADPTKRRPIDWVHTANAQAEVVRDYVKWDAEATVAELFAPTIRRAHTIAHTGPPGPTYVSLDAAAQEQRLVHEVALTAGDCAAAAPVALHPDPTAIEGATARLATAHSIGVVAGRLARDPTITPLLVELVETLGAAYQDERNTVCFPTAHPLNCTGQPTALAACDIVLCIGVGDISATVERGRHPPENHPSVIEIGFADLGMPSWAQVRAQSAIADIRIVADPVRGTRALLAGLRGQLIQSAIATRRSAVANQVAELRETQRKNVVAFLDEVPISPTRLVSELWAAVRGSDWQLLLRNTRSWPEGVWQFLGAGDFIGHSVGGGVGYGPGAMVGGALAAIHAGRLGVGIIGDGDFLMASGALWTAVHYRVPMLMVVNDNNCFYNDEEHQAQVARHRGRPVTNASIGVRIDNPPVDIAGLARSYGAWATGPIERPDDLAQALSSGHRHALHGEVAVVHVRTSRDS